MITNSFVAPAFGVTATLLVLTATDFRTDTPPSHEKQGTEMALVATRYQEKQYYDRRRALLTNPGRPLQSKTGASPRKASPR
jgi:hypothetical protein